jgi:tetratricopeptide (TPR) repeat protein
MFRTAIRAICGSLLLTTLASAQQGPPTPAPPPPPIVAPPKPTATPTPTPAAPEERIPIFISGNVVVADGSTPPERVVIERVCASGQVRFEGYTDSRGNFGIQLGLSQQLLPDVSNVMFVEDSQGFSGPTRVAREGMQDIYYDCELRARLAGYTSTTLMLAGRKPLDPAAIGTLTLIPASGQKIDNRPVSVTSASAPKDARKALERGQEEAKKGRYEKAEAELLKAVNLHPPYTEAWTELGKVYRSLKRPEDARAALDKAVAADPNFAPAYEQMYQIAFEGQKWTELAGTTQQLLALNPYGFPDAYYFNGVAHLQLRNWDTAETSLLQAIKADRMNTNPKTHYVLGLVLVQKKQFKDAADRFQIFLQLAPKDPQANKAKVLWAELKGLQP